MLLRLLLILIVLVLALALIAALVGPLLIDPAPAPGKTSAQALERRGIRFVEIPFPGTEGLSLHVAEQAPDVKSAPPPTFVLLHGFTFNLYTWNRIMAPLAERGRVIAYDQIPYGLSAKPLPGTWHGENPYSKAAALKQLMVFLDELKVGQVFLVGNSSGGTLALEAALAYPERVRGLILLAPWVNSKRPILPQWLVDLPQTKRLTLLLARALGTNSPLLDRGYADPTRIDAERRALTGVHREIANWDAAWAALLQRSLTDRVEIAKHLGEIQTPALVITGAKDRIVPPTDTLEAASALPNATFAELPDCGHLPQEECPTQVMDVIGQWLDGLQSKEEAEGG
ncbi:MAG: alpha/beta hydrolase [Thiohalocapsa sp.]|uniref:alpha/beta fold hydrolase n=1 Tax=Thiohalocapsa sp. TaxID=2497641 RepID=UPI0025E9C4A7|nr:alpha/beta hydrolase [Thiohalocapsa sp.]MCG6940599.1 alpha/beta hydrolase [Thiohalocapsa sp.]